MIEGKHGYMGSKSARCTPTGTGAVIAIAIAVVIAVAIAVVITQLGGRGDVRGVIVAEQRARQLHQCLQDAHSRVVTFAQNTSGGRVARKPCKQKTTNDWQDSLGAHPNANCTQYLLLPCFYRR